MKHTLTSIRTTANTLILIGSLAGVASAELIHTFQFEDHTYQIYSDALTWTAARDFAATQTLNGKAGYLTRIDSAAENEEIYNNLLAYTTSLTSTAPDGGGVRYAWIGASDLTSEGDWIWENGKDQFWQGDYTGSALDGMYHNWGDEPDDFLGNQDAAAIALDDWPFGFVSQWNDLDEDNNLPFIVEFSSIPEPSSALILGLGALGIAARRKRSV